MRSLEYAELSDDEIMKRIRNQDKEALDYLLERYKNVVRKKANTMFLIGGDKDDLIQEGMIGLYKAIRDFDFSENTSFRTFAELCVSRQMYSAIKQSCRKKHNPLNDYVSFDTPAFKDNGEGHSSLLDIFQVENQNPEELVIDKEYASMLKYELERRLSSMERNVLALYLCGANYREIAIVLNKEPKSIDNALQRIRTKLSSLVEQMNQI